MVERAIRLDGTCRFLCFSNACTALTVLLLPFTFVELLCATLYLHLMNTPDLTPPLLHAHLSGTGEHGVGIGKREYLYEELGPGTVGLMKTIKHALDPHNLFNPGKVGASSLASSLLVWVMGWFRADEFVVSCTRTTPPRTHKPILLRARALRRRCTKRKGGRRRAS